MDLVRDERAENPRDLPTALIVSPIFALVLLEREEKEVRM
jgi:hypothetical protein